MRASLILCLMLMSVAAFSADKNVSYTEPAKTIKISYDIQSETDTEAVIVNPKAVLDSKVYYMHAGMAAGFLCNAIGYRNSPSPVGTFFQSMPQGNFADVILLNQYGNITLAVEKRVLHTIICEK